MSRARAHPLHLPSASPVAVVAVLPNDGVYMWQSRERTATQEGIKERAMAAQLWTFIRAVETGKCSGASTQEQLRILPFDRPAVFHMRGNSLGCPVKDAACAASPTFVMAHAPSLGRTGGIMSPNPFFVSYNEWEATERSILEAARRKPLERRRRRWRVMWRGKLWVPEKNNRSEVVARAAAKASLARAARGSACVEYPGNLARLRATLFTMRDPRLFDIRLRNTSVRGMLATGCKSAYEEDPRVARALTPPRPRRAPPLAVEATYIELLQKYEYSQWPVLINLPGSSSGGYSKNLNHLWATGGAVMLWNRDSVHSSPLYREWYHVALSPNATHVEVHEGNLLDVASAVLRKSGRSRLTALAAGATQVHRELVCPCCLAEFYSRSVAAIAAQQSQVHGANAIQTLRQMTASYASAFGGSWTRVAEPVVEPGSWLAHGERLMAGHDNRTLQRVLTRLYSGRRTRSMRSSARSGRRRE